MPRVSRSLAVCAALCFVGAIRADDSTLKFTDVTQAAGLVEPLAGIMGHGAAWGDLDGDGLLDLSARGGLDRRSSATWAGCASRT